MQVGEIMTRGVKLIHPQDSIRDAARQMRDEDVGSLPVADGDRLVGYVTDRDIVVRAIADSGGPDSPVSEAMSDRILYCFEDETVDSVAKNMAQESDSSASRLDASEEALRHCCVGRSRQRRRRRACRAGAGRDIAPDALRASGH